LKSPEKNSLSISVADRLIVSCVKLDVQQKQERSIYTAKDTISRRHYIK
jgi:hypothetical protein